MALGQGTGPSNYPGGFSQGVTLQNTPVSIPHPGKVFWVNNSTVLAPGGIAGSDANDGTYTRPFSTLDYAVGRCTAGRGDVIYIMPGYAQTMTAADAVDVDVADVRIIGLGRGLKRPRFTYTATAGEFVIGAVNVRIENLVFVPGVSAVTHAVDVEAAATDAEIINCSFEIGASGFEFNAAITAVAGSDRGRIQGCYFNSGAEGAIYAISLGTPTDWVLRDNVIFGDYSTACIGTITGAGVRSHMYNNVVCNGLPGDVNTVEAFTQSAAGTWFVGGNLFVADLATAVLFFTNYTSTVNLGNLYTDDTSMAATAVDRTASIVVMADG